MTRFASSENEAQAGQASVYLVTLAALGFSSGFVRAHDGAGVLRFGGNDYFGVGQYGGIEVVEETTEVIARGVKCTLSGVDASLISTLMTEKYQGRAASFYLGILNSDTLQFIYTPEEIWSGRMDTMSVSLGAGEGVITLTCEHRLRREPPAARYTNEDQKTRHPGDTFFDLLHTIPQYRSSWGERPTSYGPGVYPPGYLDQFGGF